MENNGVGVGDIAVGGHMGVKGLIIHLQESDIIASLPCWIEIISAMEMENGQICRGNIGIGIHDGKQSGSQSLGKIHKIAAAIAV